MPLELYENSQKKPLTLHVVVVAPIQLNLKKSFWFANSSYPGRPTRSALTRLPVEIIQIYRIVGYFAFGAVATLLTTEIAKYQVNKTSPSGLREVKTVHCDVNNWNLD